MAVQNPEYPLPDCRGEPIGWPVRLLLLPIVSLPAFFRPPMSACAFGLTLLLAAAGARAGASPELDMLAPRGGQRGQEVLVEFTGNRLDRALDVIIHEPGISFARLEQKDNHLVKCWLKVDAAARVGLYTLRLRTAQGLSNLKLFSVGNLPQIEETEPNNDRNQPQAITPPVTINGIVKSEDVDVYAFDGRKDQTWAFEVEGIRLGDTLFDPHLAVYDASGRELVAADDTPLLRQDAAAVVNFPADGRYFVEVRETAYRGDDRCRYRLHVGPFPRPLAVLPAGGQAGSEVELTWIGAGPALTHKIKLPDAVSEDFGILPQVEGAVAPSPVPFRLNRLPAVVETEPNNADEQANAMPAPGGASGVISGERDVDCFVFEGKKDQTFDASVFARRLRSPLDSVLNVRRLKGAGLTGNDDGAGPDSTVRFKCPEDGKYVFEIRDLLFKSGPEYTYYLELAPATPRLALSVLPEQATLAVPAGNRAAVLVTASRSDFGGPLQLSADGMPAGMQMQADTMSDAVNQMPVVFEAAPQVPPAGALIDLAARPTDANQKIEGHLRQTIELVKFQNQPLYTASVSRLAAAVIDPVPFKISIVEPQVPMVRRGMMELGIKAERSGDFKGEINVRMLWTPPGVSAGTLKLAGDKSAGTIHLDANEGARVGKWKVAAVAVADIGGGPMEVASQLATLEVADPLIEFTVEKTRTELGKPVDMLVKIAHKAPFEGQAQAELVGLPPKVATTQTAVGPETPEVKYTLQVPTSAPAGHHGGVFVRAVVHRNGESIVHQSAPAELILDAPLPPKDPQEEARRAEAKRKAEEEKERKKAERLAAAARRRAEREKQK